MKLDNQKMELEKLSMEYVRKVLFITTACYGVSKKSPSLKAGYISHNDNLVWTKQEKSIFQSLLYQSS